MNPLPVIDISPLYANDDQAWHAVARQIDAACREWGFFYIKGHPISAERIDQVIGSAQRFFAQPLSEKLKIDITQSQHHRGYGAIATEQLDPDLPSDLKETFDMGLHLPADHPDVLAGKPLRGPNRHPDLPGWQSLMDQHYRDMQALALTLLRAMTPALGIERRLLRSTFRATGQRVEDDPLPAPPHRHQRTATRRWRSHRLRLHHLALPGRCRRSSGA
jgi:isopenicillin N synthase-like dioxygenase